MNNKIVVRFAPSPTGSLHIGGARTAIYNILFAKNKKATCILRIDDTDLVRSDDKFSEEITESLKWLELIFQETYKQSLRFSIYDQYLEDLMDKGLVYSEKTEKGEALIFKAEKKPVVFNDLIRGKITIDAEEVKDIVLKKSDGTPTYLFASTVDDIDLGVTHIIRGEDHISNTFKQKLLFQAISPDKTPFFAHLPLILSDDGSRLSKRHGATSVLEFKKMGYLPEAIINYLMLLGWSPGNNTELLKFNEAGKLFNIENVRKSGSKFSYEKALWMNGKYIAETESEDLINRCIDLGMKSIEHYMYSNADKLIKTFNLTKSRMRLLTEFNDAVSYFFEPNIIIPEELLEKSILKNNTFLNSLKKIKETISAIDDFTSENLDKNLRELILYLELKTKDILIPLRIILTAREKTPGIFEVMELMGKELCLKRIIDCSVSTTR